MSVRVIKKIEKSEIKQLREIKGKLRVTAYARVSTGETEQLNSYESQKQYYKEKIIEHDSWEYVDIYADEAISGTLAYKRVEFMKMISDGLSGKFDVILTKSISRFARNTVDTLNYVRKLKEKNIAVIFEEENINTLDMSGELLLTILSSVAQQESETLSTHIKLGFKMRKERGDIIGNASCYGYYHDTKLNKFIIKPEEASIVKFIFSEYLEGYGCKSISKKLHEMGVKSPRGKNMWSDTTIAGILKNEKYIGDVLQGKTFTVDAISHKRLKNYGEEDKYYIENNHEPIISKEDFTNVQEYIKKKRGAMATGRRLGNYGKNYPMSGKIKCGHCGALVGRRSMRNMRDIIPIWKCINTTKVPRVNCQDSKAIRESVLESIFTDMCTLIYEDSLESFNLLRDTVKNIVNDNSNFDKLKKLNKKKLQVESNKNKLVDLIVNGSIDSKTFEIKNNKLKNEVDKIEKEIDQYSALVNDDSKIDEGLNKLEDLLNTKRFFKDFDSDMFDAMIDYVIMGCYDENNKFDPHIVKFICKKQFSQTLRNEITKERVLASSKVVGCENVVILDFISKQNIYSFEKEGLTLKKKLIKGIRVIFEIEN